MSGKAGWTRVAFGDVVRQVKDRVDPEESGLERYVAGEHMDTDDLRIRRWGTIGDGYLGPAFHMRFKPGQVLYGSRRTYLRKVAVADFEGITANTTFVLEPKDSRGLLPESLPLVMQTEAFHEHAIKQSKGSVNPYINFSDLTWFEFWLPPLNEQRRIAAAFASIVSAAEELRRLGQRVDAIEQAFLVDAFGLAVGRPPGQLSVVPLASLAEVRQGLAKGRRADADTTTRPYLRVANVKDGELDLGEIKDIVVARDQVDRYTLRTGDVLMTEGGDLDKLGRGTVWQGEVAGCLHQNHVFAVRPDGDKLDPWYLAALARSPYGRQYFLGCAKRTSNLASVNKQQVSQLPVPMLAIAEQRRWVQQYRSIRAVAVRVGARRQSTDFLRRAFLTESGLSR